MKIVIEGCDGRTIITEKDWGGSFTPSEMATLRKLSKLSHKISSYACMPVVDIGECSILESILRASREEEE